MEDHRSARLRAVIQSGGALPETETALSLPAWVGYCARTPFEVAPPITENKPPGVSDAGIVATIRSLRQLVVGQRVTVVPLSGGSTKGRLRVLAMDH
jgi:hypothetical protein